MSTVKLGDVARESRLKWERSKLDVPIVGLEHLIPGEIRFEAYDKNIDNTFSKKFVKGQVLFGRRRSYQRKAAVAEFDGICSGDITVIETIGGKMVSELLPFIIQTPAFFDYANKGSAGSLSPRVKWEHLADYEFELPSLKEQKVLADKLWAAYRLKEGYKKLYVATDEMVKSQFIEMFGEANNMCSSVFSDFVTLKAGKSKKVDEIQSEKSAGLYPCFGGNGIRGYVNDYTHDGEYCIIGRQGALCGNVQVVKGKFYATEHAVVVTPKAKLNTIWLFYSLTQMNLNQYARGVAQPGLAVNQLEKLAFCIPQLESQRKFAAIAIQSDKSKFDIQKALVYLNNSQRVELSKIA